MPTMGKPGLMGGLETEGDVAIANSWAGGFSRCAAFPACFRLPPFFLDIETIPVHVPAASGLRQTF